MWSFITGGKLFQFCWPPAWDQVHMTVKELLSIVVACAMWGRRWPGCSVRILCDNAAIIRAGTSKDSFVMHLLRCLFFFTARYQLMLLPKHLPGRENVAADYLSRDALSSFRQVVSHANVEPTTLPDNLMEALVLQCPVWTSSSWRDVLRSSFLMA